MRTAPYDGKTGMKVWLSASEQQELTEWYDTDPEKQVAVSLCLHGLRASEVVAVTLGDLRERETGDEREAWTLTVQDGKTGHREVPLRAETRRLMATYANASGKRKDDPVVDRTTTTIHRWVKRAASEALEGDAAAEVGPHDLRRTWATETYWRLARSGAGGDAQTIVMEWGGWTRDRTFSENYLGAIPDHIAVGFQEAAGLD